MAKSTWIFIIIVLIVLAFFAFIIAGIISLFLGGTDTSKFSTGNVALIQIKGVIVTEKEPFLFTEENIVSTDVIELIDKAEKNPAIHAIVFEINSPGGSAVASEEIANRIKDIKKPNISSIN